MSLIKLLFAISLILIISLLSGGPVDSKDMFTGLSLIMAAFILRKEKDE